LLEFVCSAPGDDMNCFTSDMLRCLLKCVQLNLSCRRWVTFRPTAAFQHRTFQMRGCTCIATPRGLQSAGSFRVKDTLRVLAGRHAVHDASAPKSCQFLLHLVLCCRSSSFLGLPGLRFVIFASQYMTSFGSTTSSGSY